RGRDRVTRPPFSLSLSLSLRSHTHTHTHTHTRSLSLSLSLSLLSLSFSSLSLISLSHYGLSSPSHLILPHPHIVRHHESTGLALPGAELQRAAGGLL